jgi:hypothetical protein
MELDYKNRSITWWKNNDQIAQIPIPAKMVGQTIYLSILMWEKGDQIDLAVVSA